MFCILNDFSDEPNWWSKISSDYHFQERPSDQNLAPKYLFLDGNLLFHFRNAPTLVILYISQQIIYLCFMQPFLFRIIL